MARSTFQSQNVKKLRGSDHFWSNDNKDKHGDDNGNNNNDNNNNNNDNNYNDMLIMS